MRVLVVPMAAMAETAGSFQQFFCLYSRQKAETTVL